MTFLLIVIYWMLGTVMAFAFCGAIGAGIACLITLFRIPSRRENIKLLPGYLILCLLSAAVGWGVLLVAGWIGDRTVYIGQWGILAGLAWPGIIALKFISEYTWIALKQTAGIDTEKH